MLPLVQVLAIQRMMYFNSVRSISRYVIILASIFNVQNEHAHTANMIFKRNIQYSYFYKRICMLITHKYINNVY